MKFLISLLILSLLRCDQITFDNDVAVIEPTTKIQVGER